MVLVQWFHFGILNLDIKEHAATQTDPDVDRQIPARRKLTSITGFAKFHVSDISGRVQDNPDNRNGRDKTRVWDWNYPPVIKGGNSKMTHLEMVFSLTAPVYKSFIEFL